MRRLLTAMTALLFAACGGSPTGPGGVEIPDGPLSLALVQGDGQEVAVTDTLPTDVVVQITKGGDPLPNQLVDWVVLQDNCGSPFVTTTRTDNDGQTGNRLVAGTRAWTRPDGPDVCQMEVRYTLVVSDTVQARVDTTVGYYVGPGKVSEVIIDEYTFTGQGTRTVDGDVVADAYGNPALWRLRPDCCAHREGDEYGTVDARTLTVDSAGKGHVHAVVADTIVATGILETGTGGGIRIDFAAYDGGQ